MVGWASDGGKAVGRTAAHSMVRRHGVGRASARSAAAMMVVSASTSIRSAPLMMRDGASPAGVKTLGDCSCIDGTGMSFGVRIGVGVDCGACVGVGTGAATQRSTSSSTSMRAKTVLRSSNRCS